MGDICRLSMVFRVRNQNNWHRNSSFPAARNPWRNARAFRGHHGSGFQSTSYDWKPLGHILNNIINLASVPKFWSGEFCLWLAGANIPGTRCMLSWCY